MGCSAPSSSPEATYKKFFRSLVAYSRTGFSGYQAQAYELLTKANRDTLTARVKVINKSLAKGVRKLKPAQLLLVRRTPKGRTIESIKRGDITTDSIILKVTYSIGEDEVTLRLEDKKWKIELPLPPLEASG